MKKTAPVTDAFPTGPQDDPGSAGYQRTVGRMVSTGLFSFIRLAVCDSRQPFRPARWPPLLTPDRMPLSSHLKGHGRALAIT